MVQDPRAPRPYLVSNRQNVHNRVVLVCTVNVYISASLDQRPILRYQVLQVRINCTRFTFSLRTDSYVICRGYCKQFEINIATHLLPAVFRQLSDTLNIESKKHNPNYI